MHKKTFLLLITENINIYGYKSLKYYYYIKGNNISRFKLVINYNDLVIKCKTHDIMRSKQSYIIITSY